MGYQSIFKTLKAQEVRSDTISCPFIKELNIIKDKISHKVLQK
jgi:hypothetical protein